MKKIKEFMNTPITWGAYAKLCVGCYVASMAMVGLTLAKINHDYKSIMETRKELDDLLESEQDDNVIEFSL